MLRARTRTSLEGEHGGADLRNEEGDTVTRLAKQVCDDPMLATRIAEYNGIRSPNLVFVEQQIGVPSRKELVGGPVATGCFAVRRKRTESKLSTHSWGIAIDLNPETDPMGSSGEIAPGVVGAFRSFVFKCGGDRPGKGKDPMNSQYCTGY
jgi:hypothetical protein